MLPLAAATAAARWAGTAALMVTMTCVAVEQAMHESAVSSIGMAVRQGRLMNMMTISLPLTSILLEYGRECCTL